MSATTPDLYSAATYRRFTNLASFIAAAVVTWAGLDNGQPLLSIIGAVILVLSSFGLFFRRDGKAGRVGTRADLHTFFERNRRWVSLLTFVVSAVLLWHAIDIKATLASLCGGLLLAATAFDLYKKD